MHLNNLYSLYHETLTWLLLLPKVSTFLLWQLMNLAMHSACPTQLTVEKSCTHHPTLAPIMSCSSPSTMSKTSNTCMVSLARLKRIHSLLGFGKVADPFFFQTSKIENEKHHIRYGFIVRLTI